MKTIEIKEAANRLGISLSSGQIATLKSIPVDTDHPAEWKAIEIEEIILELYH